MQPIEIAVAVLSVCSGADQAGLILAQSAATDTVHVEVVGNAKNPWGEPATLFGVLGVFGGLAGVLLQRYWHRRDAERAADRAERERVQVHVFDSLKWFEGKTQKRSIGIAVVEGNWDRFPDLHATWVAVLVNQAVYLLAESGQEDAEHEVDNFIRIKTLLTKPDANMTLPQRKAVAGAIDKNLDGRGLRKLDPEVLKTWRSTLLSAV